MEMSADFYDEMGVPICEHALKHVRRLVPEFDTKASMSNARILDVCCGTGAVTMILAEKAHANSSIMAIDNADEYVKLMEAKLLTAGLQSKVCAKVEDATTLSSCGDNEFDFVTSSVGTPWVFEDRDDRIKALASVYRVTKPGGLFVFTTWVMEDVNDLPFLNDEDARSEMTAAGWPGAELKIYQESMEDPITHEPGDMFSDVRIFSIVKPNP